MEHIQMEIRGHVGTITLDRRSRFNSLDVRTARDLRKAGLQMARDPGVRAVILRGAPGAFCSGVDLKYVQQGGDPDDLTYLRSNAPNGPGHGAIFKQILEYLHATLSEIRRAPKPFVAAVDGAAGAGGLGLALACDLVIASERASFAYAYFRTGLSGAEGTTFMLPKLIGLRKALDMAFLGERLEAHQALRMGLISAVYPTEHFDAAVDRLADRLAEGPTAAMAAAKRLMFDAAGGDRYDAHLDRELENLVRSADSADFDEGLQAFFQRRVGHFTGRW